VAVASAGPYANYLHLAPDSYPCQYLTTWFLQAGCPSCHPSNSVKALNTYKGNVMSLITGYWLTDTAAVMSLILAAII